MNSKFIAKGGLLVALSFILVYLATLMPTSKLVFIVLTTCIIMVSITVTNIKNALTIYLATSLLAFLLIGLKFMVLAYILFFGIYGFIKYLTEKTNKRLLEWFLKFVFLNISFSVLLLLASNLIIKFPMNTPPINFIINSKYAIYYFLVLAQIIFVIFDYALTLFITYISKYINKYINKL